MKAIKAIITPIKATTLTPFAYHSVMVQNGTATLPELISDNAIGFGLAASLGMMSARVTLPTKDYYRDWSAMPWRCSVLTTETPRLLSPLIRRLNITEEGGYKRKLQDLTKKGNYKDFFQTQEVPPNNVFTGALFGFDPFAMTGLDEIVVRIGLHRNGMVKLERAEVDKVAKVRLNAATAALFARKLTVERFLLYGIQLSAWLPLKAALQEVKQWQ